MPDDFVLNVRQISQYAQQAGAPPSMRLLTQTGGMGGPYGSIAPADLVSTALAPVGSAPLNVGGNLGVSGTIWSSGVMTIENDAFLNGAVTINGATTVNGYLWADSFDAGSVKVDGVAAATLNDVAKLAARPFVASVNGQTGAIRLSVDDVMGAAPLFAPYFSNPRANTPWPNACDAELVTAEWVRNFFLNGNAVASFNGRRGSVRLRLTDLLEAGGAPINSPELVGKPLAPTPPGYDLSDRIATTRFVKWAIDEGGWRGPPGPPGIPGPPGTGFNFRGTVPTLTDLPPSGNEVGDMFIASDTDMGHVWDGSAWQPIGIIAPSARVYVADSEPAVAGNGDLWWDSANGELLVYYEAPPPGGSQWVIANTGLSGPQGPEGPEGPAGPNVSIGAAPPFPAQSGWLWYNPSTGNTQVFDGVNWLPVSEPTATVTVGTTQPVGAAEGDLWFDTSSTGELMVYTQGVWVAAASGIEGPQGPTGPPGTPGIQGIQGVQGPPGTGIQFKGDQPTLADIQALPSPAQGDGWVDLSTGDLWVFDGSAWAGPYPFGGGISEAPTPGIYGRENGGWVQLLDDGVF